MINDAGQQGNDGGAMARYVEETGYSERCSLSKLFKAISYFGQSDE